MIVEAAQTRNVVAVGDAREDELSGVGLRSRSGSVGTVLHGAGRNDAVSLLSLLVSHGRDAVVIMVIFGGYLERLAFAQSAKKDVNETFQSL